MRLTFRRRHRVDSPGLLAEIAGTRPPPGYDRSAEQHRDFRQLFLGSEQGKRVLWSMLEWTRMYRTSLVRGDHDAIFANEGARTIGLKLLMTVHEEPGERPERANSERKT